MIKNLKLSFVHVVVMIYMMIFHQQFIMHMSTMKFAKKFQNYKKLILLNLTINS